MGPEAGAEEAIATAVEEARRLRGTVMLAADQRERQWCAVCAAVDGRAELRVGEPAPRGWRRRAPEAQEAWLRDHGFTHVWDAWALPVPAESGPETCAGILAGALREGLGIGADAELRRVLVESWSPGREAPSPGAPHGDHLAAAMRALASAGEGRLHVEGGRPARLWAWVWAKAEAGELLVECELPATADDAAEDWREPMTGERAEAAARRLAARIEAAAAGEPLYVTFLPGAPPG